MKATAKTLKYTLTMAVFMLFPALLAIAGLAQVYAQGTETPARPTGLTGTVEHDQVALTWDDPEDETSITGYQVLRWQRGVHNPGDFQVHVDDTGNADTSYVDTDVEAEARYVYRIKARNAAGLSPRSGYFDADLPEPPVPSAPTGLTGTVQHDGVSLTWDDPEDDSITGYQVLRLQRGVDELGSFNVHVDDTGSADTSYTDADVQYGSQYVYRIKARNEAGLSSRSGYFNAAVPQPPQVTASFEQAAHTVEEGDNATIAVVLDVDPERDLTIKIIPTNMGGAQDTDYSGVSDLAFSKGDTRKEFTFTATDDEEDDDGESVKLSFGTLPHRVSEGTTDEATVSITDNDEPEETANSTRETATDLGDITSLTGGDHLDGQVNQDDDASDYFSFTLMATRQVTATLTNLTKNAQLYLQDSDGNQLASSENEGATTDAVREVLEAGTYYLLVTPAEQEPIHYRLGWRAIPAAEEDTTDRLDRVPNAPEELVHNRSAGIANTRVLGSENQGAANQFTTGPTAGGYLITTVRVGLGYISGSDSIRVRIMTERTHSGTAIPHLRQSSLDPPSTLLGENRMGAANFTPPGSAVLAPNTNYWLEIARLNGGMRYWATPTDTETGQPGWSIADQRRRTTDSLDWTTSVSSTAPLYMVISGEPALPGAVVSNMSQFWADNRNVDSSDRRFATSFTTGLHANGYDLSTIAIRMGGFDSGDAANLSIYTNHPTNDHPHGLLTNLETTQTDRDDNDKLWHWTPVRPTALEPGTKYWLAVERTAGSFTVARAASNDQNGLSNWVIGDVTQQPGTNEWTQKNNSNRHLMFGVAATQRSSPVSTPAKALLVSNTDETQSHHLSITSGATPYASSFTTGPNTNGYTIEDIEIRGGTGTSNSAIEAEIRNSESDGTPGSTKHTLRSPTALPTGDDQKIQLTPPAGARLQPNTTYWLVLTNTGGNPEVSTTTSNNQIGSPGWTVGNTSRRSTGLNNTSTTGHIRFTLKGQINQADTTAPELDVAKSYVTNTGEEIILVFDEDIDETTANLPLPGAFSLTIGTETLNVHSVKVSTSHENRIILTHSRIGADGAARS